MLKNIFQSRSFAKLGLFGSLIAVVGLAVVLFAIPQVTNIHTSAENCQNPPVVPTLNYWPVIYTDSNTPQCMDFPAIDAALDVQNPQFSTSAADWSNGLDLGVGQQGVALMYIHNGAANNLDPAITTAKNVKISTVTDTTVGSQHKISVTFKGDNTNTVTQSFTIHTPANAKLEIVPNSGYVYDYKGAPVAGKGALNIGNSTYTLGDMKSCFEFSMFLSFKFKVTGTTTPSDTTLSINKQVRSLDKNSAFADSVAVNQNERVQYRIAVKNTGSVVAQNVVLSDTGAAGVNFETGTATIDGITSSSVIPGAISLGDMQVGQEKVIVYNSKTVATSGSLVNTATAKGTNTASVSDTALVTVNPVVNPGNPAISIAKVVKNDTTGTGYNEVVSAKTGERVTYQVTVTNTGNTVLTNTRFDDVIPAGLNLDTATVRVDGVTYTTTRNLILGSMNPGQSKQITFSATVTAAGNTYIRNIAYAAADNVGPVNDPADVTVTVVVNPGQPNIVLSKRAFNDTKNVDATTTDASREDFVTFTLTTTNTGTGDAVNYVIRDDLSQVLPLADLIEANGATLSGSVLTYPSVTIRAGETVTKTFKVRVKNSLAQNLTYKISNTYGNTVIVNIPGKQIFVAPKTGSAATSAAIFAGLITAGFVVLRKRNALMAFIKA